MKNNDDKNGFVNGLRKIALPFVAGLFSLVGVSSAQTNSAPVVDFTGRNKENVRAGVVCSANSGLFGEAYVPVCENVFVDGKLVAGSEFQGSAGAGLDSFFDNGNSVFGINSFVDGGYVNGGSVGAEYLTRNFGLHGNFYIGSNDKVSHRAADLEGVFCFSRGENYRAEVFAGVTFGMPENSREEMNFTVGAEYNRSLGDDFGFFAEARIDSSNMYDSQGVSGRVGLSYNLGGQGDFREIRRRQPHFHLEEKAEDGMDSVVVDAQKDFFADYANGIPDDDGGISGSGGSGNPVGNTGITGSGGSDNPVGNSGISGSGGSGNGNGL